MKRVLLTGATGFIGRACIGPLLTRGFEIHAVGRSGCGDTDAIVFHRADLLDLNCLPNLVAKVSPTHLLHCAWGVTDGAYWSSRENLDWLASGALLLEAFSRSGGHRAVGIGTCAEYRWDGEICIENHSALEPATLYGACKLALYHAFAGARDLQLSTAWARIFFPYGAYERRERLIPSVIRALIAGRPVDCTEGRQVRDPMHADDVGEALTALLDCDVTGPVNIAVGIGCSVRQIVEEIVNQLGHRELVQFGRLQARRGDPNVLIADCRRLREEIGFRPSISLSEGIARTIAYWRRNERADGAKSVL